MFGVGAVKGGTFHYFYSDCMGLAAGSIEQDFGGQGVQLDGKRIFGGIGEGGAYVVVGTGPLPKLVRVGGHVEERGHGVSLRVIAQEISVGEVGDVRRVLADEFGEPLHDFDGGVGGVLRPGGVGLGD